MNYKIEFNTIFYYSSSLYNYLAHFKFLAQVKVIYLALYFLDL